MKYTINSDFIAVATEFELQPMSTCPLNVEVMLENPGGVLIRGRWDGRSKEWRSWIPFPKRRKDDKDRTEIEIEGVPV